MDNRAPDWRLLSTSKLELIVANIMFNLYIGDTKAREERLVRVAGEIADEIERRHGPWILTSPGCVRFSTTKSTQKKRAT